MSDTGNLILPPGALETLEAAAQTPPGTGPAGILQPGLIVPGGIALFPIDQQSLLQVNVRAANTSGWVNTQGQIAVNTRTIDPQGNVTNSQYTYSWAINAGLAVTTNLPPGFLISCCVTDLSGSAVSGQLFCTVSLVHQAGGAQPVDAVLINGWIQAPAPLAWPLSTLQNPWDGPGQQITHIVPNPSPGLNAVYTFTALNSLVVSIQWVYTTSSLGSARNAQYYITTNVSIQALFGEAATAQAPSTAEIYAVMPGLRGSSDALGTDTPYLLPCPRGIYVPSGGQLQIGADGLLAGDTITDVYLICQQWC